MKLARLKAVISARFTKCVPVVSTRARLYAAVPERLLNGAAAAQRRMATHSLDDDVLGARRRQERARERRPAHGALESDDVDAGQPLPAEDVVALALRLDAVHLADLIAHAAAQVDPVVVERVV